MAIKVKVGKIGLLDIMKFKNSPKEREGIISAAPLKEVDAKFAINENAMKLHPHFQHMIIDDIIVHEGANAKSFILKKEDSSPAAYFRAGQYISILLNINGSLVTRPYSISSSPKWASQGKIAITVRSNPGGFAADWMLENFKKGDAVTVSSAEGNFYYERIRDASHVIALAGGSGITPFLSMAYAIRDKLEDFSLTIISGSRTEDSILFKSELDAIAAECDKVKIVHVLSDEEKEGYEHGFITAELIKKYAPEGEYSIFLCGPEAMYRFAETELKKLDKGVKNIRRELLGVTKSVQDREDYPAESRGKTYSILVRRGPDEFNIKGSAAETVLAAIERAGINAPARCRSGECGWCRSKLVSGSVYLPAENDGRRFSDKEHGYIHPCASFPTSDLVIEVPGSYLE